MFVALGITLLYIVFIWFVFFKAHLLKFIAATDAVQRAQAQLDYAKAPCAWERSRPSSLMRLPICS